MTSFMVEYKSNSFSGGWCHKDDARDSFHDQLRQTYSHIKCTCAIDNLEQIREAQQKIFSIVESERPRYHMSYHIGKFYNETLGRHQIIVDYVRYIENNFPAELDELLQYAGDTIITNKLKLDHEIISLIIERGYVKLSEYTTEYILTVCRDVESFFRLYESQIRSLLDLSRSIKFIKMMHEYGWDITFSRFIQNRLKYCWDTLAANANIISRDATEINFFFDNVKESDLANLSIDHMKVIYRSIYLDKFLEINPETINFKKISRTYFMSHFNVGILRKYYDLNGLFDIVGEDADGNININAGAREAIDLVMDNPKFVRGCLNELLNCRTIV